MGPLHFSVFSSGGHAARCRSWAPTGHLIVTAIGSGLPHTYWLVAHSCSRRRRRLVLPCLPWPAWRSLAEPATTSVQTSCVYVLVRRARVNPGLRFAAPSP